MSHPDLLWASFFYEAHSRHPTVVAREARTHRLQEAPVDFVDDLQLSRQEHFEPRQWPLLERLRQQRVIRVGQRARREIPCFVPPELRFVQENPHQLGYCERGMRVVELYRDLVRKRGPVVACGAEPADRISQRESHEEILLEEAQPLPFRCGVVWIEHSRQRLSGECFSQSSHEIATTELLEVEVIWRGGGPQAQGIDRSPTVPTPGAVGR